MASPSTRKKTCDPRYSKLAILAGYEVLIILETLGIVAPSRVQINVLCFEPETAAEVNFGEDIQN